MLNTIVTRAKTKWFGAIGASVVSLSLAFAPMAGSASTGRKSRRSSWSTAPGRTIKLERRDRAAREGGLHGVRAAKSVAGPGLGCSDGRDIRQVDPRSGDPGRALLWRGGDQRRGAQRPECESLVYVDAFAPDEGESPLSLLASYPPPPKDFFTRSRSRPAATPTSISPRNITGRYLRRMFRRRPRR